MTFINTYITKLAGAFFARTKVLLAIAGILLLSLLIACASTNDGGGSDDTYTVGGTVTGHTGEVSLNLTYGEKTETLEVESGTEKFTFVAKLEAGQSFTIAVTNPAGQTCRSSITAGSIVNVNITNIEVTCVTVPTYSVGGEVSGLGDGETITLTLFSTGGTAETKDITGDANETTDDTFAFDTKLAAGDTYTVTTTSTAGKTCTVAPAGEQTMGDADVTVPITCNFVMRIQVTSDASESSLTTVNVFIGDGTIPDTSGTPTRVINGSDADVVIIDFA